MALRGPRIRRVGVTALVTAAALAIGVSSAGGSRVKASDFKFRPGTITIQRGQAVTWKQVQGRHTVTFKKGSFDKLLSGSHPSVSRRFKTRGTFRYYCRFHRSLGMTGKVVVK
jgi:plastocyanin